MGLWWCGRGTVTTRTRARAEFGRSSAEIGGLQEGAAYRPRCGVVLGAVRAAAFCDYSAGVSSHTVTVSLKRVRLKESVEGVLRMGDVGTEGGSDIVPRDLQ